MYNCILVPVDGSDLSMDALMLAAELVSGDAPTLELLHVPEHAPTGEELGHWSGTPGAADDRGIEQAALDLLDQAAGAVADRGIRVNSNVLWAPPARAIVDHAAELDVDAIVMGSRGLSDLKGLFLGSVSHRVLHTAGCRVILIR